MRTAMYTAAIAIGDHRDAAVDLAFSEYLGFAGHRRFGCSRSTSAYVGW
jgi:hypothetical protein